MKVVSFRDLQKVSWLSKYSEEELLSIERDDEVNRALEQLGVDVEYGVYYYAAKHRDLTGKVEVGFMAAGDTNINRLHLTGPFSTLSDLLIASAMTDPSLTGALGELSCICRSYEQESSLDNDANFVFPCEMVEPSMNSVDAKIAELNALRDRIRGPMLAECGSLKTPEQYKEYQQEQINKGN